jgi:hypothetical protein
MNLDPLLTPAGSDTEVQFNDGGFFGADSDFTYNKTTNTLDVDVVQIEAGHLDDTSELRFRTDLAVGGQSYYSFRDAVPNGSCYQNFYRANGDSNAGKTAITDNDWVWKVRAYGWNGSAYLTLGGTLYELYDATNAYGKFVVWAYASDVVNYVFESGHEYTRIGDVDGSDYVQISSTTGNLSFAGSAEFHPRRIAQSAQPTPSSGELLVWRDTDDGKVYFVYNDADTGVVSMEMT